MKKTILALAVASIMTSLCTSAFAESAVQADVPSVYSDVSPNHWSYDALKKLAKSGIINGYGDGTFRGNATISRYEMAGIVANAITKMDKADDENKQLISKLAKEYGSELKLIGARVGELEKFKKNTLKVGFDMFAFVEADKPGGNNPKLTGNDMFNWRGRFWFSGDINDSTTFNARIGTGTAAAGYQYSASKQNNVLAVDRFNITHKDALGFDSIQWGRQRVKGLGGNLLYKSGNSDGINFTKNLSKNTTGNMGIFNIKQEPSLGDSQAVGYVSLESQINPKLKVGTMLVSNDTTVNVSDTSFKYSNDGSKIWGISSSYGMGKWTLLGEYDVAKLENPVNVDKNPRAWALQLTNGTVSNTSFYPIPYTVCNINKPGDNAFIVSYRVLEKGSIPNGLGPWASFFTSSSYTLNGKTISGNDNIKGWYYSYQYVVAKNFELSFDYQSYKFANTGEKFDNIFMVIANLSI